MTVGDYLDRVCSGSFPKAILCFGAFPSWLDRDERVIVWVSPDASPRSTPVECVRVEIGKDPHFIRMMDGHWVKAVTVKDVFDRFPGPYGIIHCDYEGMNRAIWWTDQVQDALPKAYVIPEDGHNEDVREKGRSRGYPIQAVIDGMLVMVHV